MKNKITKKDNMKVHKKTFKILGIAFLFQFFTSFSSGVFLKSTWFVSEDIGKTMFKISANPSLIQFNIFLDILTALGVIFLGAVLFQLLKKQNEKLALTAMGFYFLEAALLVVSRMSTFSLLRFSQEYVATGQPSNLLFMGQVAYDTMEFVGGTLHMLAFCLGAIIFYTLLHRSRVVPRWMSLWGLVTLFPLLVGTITQIFNYNIPFVFYVPYVPFELVIGLWILFKGIIETEENEL